MSKIISGSKPVVFTTTFMNSSANYQEEEATHLQEEWNKQPSEIQKGVKSGVSEASGRTPSEPPLIR
jgi:hypothetical protein